MATAKSNIDQQQAAILASIAQSGSAGNAVQTSNLKVLDAAQKAAQQASTMRADNIGAPASMYEKQAAQIAEPYQTSGKDGAAAIAAYNQQLGGLASVNNNYMNEVRGALPVVNSITQGQIAQIKATQDYQNQQRQWAVEDRNYTQAQRDKEAGNGAEQKAALAAVNSSPLSQDAKDTFNGLVSSAGDFGTATTQLNAARAAVQANKDMKDADKAKALADLDAVLPYVRSYYFPTYNALPTAPVAGAPVPGGPIPQPAGPGIGDRAHSAGAAVLNGLGNTANAVNPFSTSNKNKLHQALRFGR
jgi:hypothetical protein